MTKEEIKNTPKLINDLLDVNITANSRKKIHKRMEEVCDLAIKALEQQQSRDMEEIKEIIECDADAETKCKMISNILTAKPHYFEKQEQKTSILQDCEYFKYEYVF